MALLAGVGMLAAALVAGLLASAPAQAAGIEPGSRPEPQPDNPFVNGDQGQKVVNATCADLQAKLDAAKRDDFIRLDSSAGIGPAGRKLCNTAYTLGTPGDATEPQTPYYGVYLVGDPTDGNVDGFDGADPVTRSLTATGSGRVTIWALAFINGSVTTNGGALEATGDSSLGVFGSEFTNNHADGSGGAIHVADAVNPNDAGGTSIQTSLFGSTTDASKGNSAAIGGAVSVVSRKTNVSAAGAGGNEFANNVATQTGGALDWSLGTGASQNLNFDNNIYTLNKAGGSGGGAHVRGESAVSISFGTELFANNSVEPMTGAPGGDHRGGGLYLDTNGAGSVRHHNNTFRSNSIGAFPDGDLAGGGEAIVGNSTNVRSQFDKWLSNTVVRSGVENQSEGGGLALIGAGITFHGWVDVFAGNRVGSEVVGTQAGPAGEGGGIYTGSSSTLELADTTVAGNTVGAGGTFPGIAGDGDDNLKATNSLFWNPGPVPDVGGFEGLNISYTDACQANNTAYPGTGNICADPLLLNAANPGTAGTGIRQTAQSPTIDKANDSLFFQEAGEGPFRDFEGDPRPVDGDGDGHTADMGADESPPVGPNTQPQPQPQPQVTKPAPVIVAPGAVCGRREISLVRADLRRGKVVLTGLVSSRFAGKPVTILANYRPTGAAARTTLATVTANAAGQFTATVARPPTGKLIKARFRARVDRFTSFPLKLPQAVSSRSVRQVGSTIEFRGKVKRSVLGRANPVVVKRLVCGRYRKVGEAKPASNGNFVVRFATRDLAGAAFYRPETTVLDHPGGTRYVKQYGRAISISLTGQTG